MDILLQDLFQLMEDRYKPELISDPDYQDTYKLVERLFAEVEAQAGEDLRQKLDDAVHERAWFDIHAAFRWGLRLGLALHRL